MDRSRDVWFFSRDGQQSGPLTYRDLKEKADEGVLLPDHDYVWKEGMRDWCLIGTIEGLFSPASGEPMEAPPVAPHPTPDEDFAAPVSAYVQAPVEEVVSAPAPQAAVMTYEMPAAEEPDEPEVQRAVEDDPEPPTRIPGPLRWPDEFDFHPGAGRRVFLAVSVFLPLLWTAIALQVGGTKDTGTFYLVFAASPALLAVLVFCVVLMRFRNIGMTRLWVLGLWVPLLQLWLGYRLAAAPGGYARHRKMDVGGFAVAAIYWLAIVFSGVISAMVSLSPALREQVSGRLEPLMQEFSIPSFLK